MYAKFFYLFFHMYSNYLNTLPAYMIGILYLMQPCSILFLYSDPTNNNLLDTCHIPLFSSTAISKLAVGPSVIICTDSVRGIRKFCSSLVNSLVTLYTLLSANPYSSVSQICSA